MERHDPLSAAAPPAEIAALVPITPKKQRRLPPLLREIAEVKNETLAFLYGGPEQQPGDYQRNLQRAGKIRDDFVQFCTANTYFPNWRQAWSSFTHKHPPQAMPLSEPRFVAPINASALPRWKQRLLQAARA